MFIFKCASQILRCFLHRIKKTGVIRLFDTGENKGTNSNYSEKYCLVKIHIKLLDMSFYFFS